jgi:hypothetical protein
MFRVCSFLPPQQAPRAHAYCYVSPPEEEVSSAVSLTADAVVMSESLYSSLFGDADVGIVRLVPEPEVPGACAASSAHSCDMVQLALQKLSSWTFRVSCRKAQALSH